MEAQEDLISKHHGLCVCVYIYIYIYRRIQQAAAALLAPVALLCHVHCRIDPGCVRHTVPVRES